MCDIAPFCMKCVWEDVQEELFMCQANRLHAALREVKRSLPIIGEWFPPYECQGFEISYDEREEGADHE